MFLKGFQDHFMFRNLDKFIFKLIQNLAHLKKNENKFLTKKILQIEKKV